MPFISASSTGTHPWGTMLNNVSTMASNILEFRLVIANGTVLICIETFKKNILMVEELHLVHLVLFHH